MLICVTGKAGSGKDTICDHLVKSDGFIKIALADTLKRIVKDVFALDDETVYDRIKREQPLPQWNNYSVRKLLQIVGTELFRNNIDRDIWVKSLWFKLDKSILDNKEYLNKNYCISDVRFPNELNFFKEKAGIDFYSIKVIRDGCNGVVGVQNHESEKYDLETDVTLENNGTIEELNQQVDEIMHQFY
jgi:dephospho-CoA kinase